MKRKSSFYVPLLMCAFCIQMVLFPHPIQDSFLNDTLYSKSEANRISSLNELSILTRKEDFKKALNFANESLRIASQINDRSKIATGYLNIGIIQMHAGNYKQSKISLDKSVPYFRDIGDNRGLATYYSLLGDLYVKMGQNEQAYYNYNSAIERFRQLNLLNEEATILNKIGLGFYTHDDFKNSMIYYLRSLRLAERINDNNQKAISYINISNVLNSTTDYRSAILYLRKSLVIFQANNSQYNMGVCYNNIAANYINQNNLDSALIYLSKALEIYVKGNDKKGQAASYLNMGIVSSKKNNYYKAISYYNSALQINKLLNDKYRIATCMANMTIDYLALKNYQKVQEISTKGLGIAIEIKALSIQRIFYENLSKAYERLGDYRNAYLQFKLLKQVDDSLFSTEKQKQVLELEAKYQGEKKENSINTLKRDNNLQLIQLEKNRNFQFFLIISGFLVLILLIVFYRLYTLKFKTAELLNQKNSELNNLNNSLVNSENALKELNATKDKFFTIIAHDIKNPLSAYRSIAKLLSNSFDQLSDAEKISYIKRIYDSSENLYNLFQNLLLWATSQSGTIRFKPQEIDLGILTFKAISLMKENARRKDIEIDSLVNTGTFVVCDSNMISTVLLNLLSNAIKFSLPQGRVEIRANDLTDFVQISIIDSGLGMQQTDLKQLFNVEFDHKMIGNSAEKGSGIGLILCREFILRNGGEVWAESIIDQGSTFHFTLPKVLPPHASTSH